MAINALVPAAMPTHLRADVCQELMLAVLEGRTTVTELQTNKTLLKKYVRVFTRENSMITSYALSLDRPLREGSTSRSWYDVLPAPMVDDDDVLHSFEELAAAFPSVVRANGGRQTDAHLKASAPPDQCPHGRWRWEHCGRCDAQLEKAELAREENGRWPN